MQKRCISLFIYIIVGLLLTVSGYSQSETKSSRTVKSNTIISDKLPKINIAVSAEFKYVGRFPFTIRDVAGGERFVFVDAENCKVKCLFIAHFEGFFPHIDNYYKYSFTNALIFDSHKFRHNPYAYSNKESIENNPKGEAALTAAFLKEKVSCLKMS